MSIGGIFILPEHMLVDILIRLPVKSIGKSRCVSKHWLSLLSSPRFIKAHLAHHAGDEKKLLIHNSHSIFTITLSPDGVVDSNFRKLDSIPPIQQYSMLVGPCNGFKLLINPTTSELFRLPESPNSSLGLVRENPVGYGFGYDRSNDDYKVVTFTRNNGDFRSQFFIYADIYSVKRRSWRRIDHMTGSPFLSSGVAGVFVNGALHWMGCNVNYALDVTSEKFNEVPSVGSVCGEDMLLYKLISPKGCLGTVVLQKKHEIVDIWIMKEYTMAKSWTKMMSINRGWTWTTQYWTDTVMIPNKSVTELECYSLDDEKTFTLTVDRRHSKDLFNDGSFDGLMFSESLVSPHQLDTQQHEEEKEKEDEDEE